MHSQIVLSRKISILQLLGWYLNMVRALLELCLFGVYWLYSLRNTRSSSRTNFIHSLERHFEMEVLEQDIMHAWEIKVHLGDIYWIGLLIRLNEL